MISDLNISKGNVLVLVEYAKWETGRITISLKELNSDLEIIVAIDDACKTMMNDDLIMNGGHFFKSFPKEWRNMITRLDFFDDRGYPISDEDILFSENDICVECFQPAEAMFESEWHCLNCLNDKINSKISDSH